MLTRKQIILAAIEATYGTDPTPTGSDMIYTTSDLTWSPYQGDTQSRDRMRDAMGARAEVNVGPNSSLQFSVPLAGAGKAGDAPAFGALLRACGLDETTEAGTEVVYKPVSGDFESVALYYFLDGIKQVMLGARGTVVFNMNAGEFPTMDFTFTSMYAKPTSGSPTSPSVDKIADEIPVNKQNTTASIFGYSACTGGLSMDMGNSVNYRNQINCEHIDITDRETTGQVTIDAPKMADKDFFTELESHSGVNTGVVKLTHGSEAGNIVVLEGSQVQLANMSMQDSDGVAQFQFDTRYLPDSGDDEFSLTIK